MATKAKTHGLKKSVPKNEPSLSDRSSSTMNQIRCSRLVKNAGLRNLNDRYINMRYLESENASLNAMVQYSTATVENTNIKKICEDELSSARKFIHEMALEKAKLEIRAISLLEENEELKNKLKKKCKEAEITKSAARLNEVKYNESSISRNVAEFKKAMVDVKNLNLELMKLRKQFEEYRRSAEKETLARVDLENTV